MAPYITVGAHLALTSLSTVQTITVTEVQASGVLIQALTENVRITLSNTTPTASLGFQLKAGDPPQYFPLDEGMSIRLIEETASANVQYQFVA